MDSLTSINMPVPVLISMTRHGAKLARQLTTTRELSACQIRKFCEDHIMPDCVFDKAVPHIQDSFAAGLHYRHLLGKVLIRALAGANR